MMNLIKVPVSNKTPRVVTRSNWIGDSKRATTGYARWAELVHWVREHPEFVGEGEAVIAFGSPVMLFAHLGYGFLRREAGENVVASSDPFEEAVDDKWRLFAALVVEDNEEIIYGPIS